MKRIMIVGCCGAGKSTLARKLATHFNYPLVHLDQLYWKPNWVESSREEFVVKQQEALRNETWIIDGNYSSTHDIRLEKADTLIWLDYPMPLCFFRVIKRIIKNYGQSRPDMSAGCKERFDTAFLHYVLSYPWNGRPRVIRTIRKMKEEQQLLHFRKEKETNLFLAKLEVI